MSCKTCQGEGSCTYIEDSRTIEETCPRCDGYGQSLNNEYTPITSYNPYIEVNLK